MTTLIANLNEHVDQEVTMQGWVYNKRGSGKIYFLQLRDGSGTTQGIVEASSASPETLKAAEELTAESSVRISGRVAQHPKKENTFELHITAIEIVQICQDEYPISKKEHGIEFLLDQRHLWLRSSKEWATQRVRNTIINATYKFFNQNHYIKIDAPIFTPNACEGTTELFEVPYFDQGSAYLSQSGQLYLEAAIFSHGRVFDFGPVFRAEKSKTRRHLTEFWMMDAEAAFVEHHQNMDIQEALVKHVISAVLKANTNELTILERDTAPLQTVIEKSFLRKTHAQIIEELHSMGSDIQEDHDLGADDETMITKKYDVPIFVEKYPAKVKAFYMKPDPEASHLALCSDLLAPEGYGEIIGGSQREDDYDTLLQRIKEHKLPIDAFQWYLDLRKYGSVPHSGFGFGLERLVSWICGLQHVRTAIPFPRTIYRLRP